MATEMPLSLASKSLKEKFPTPTIPLTAVLQNSQVQKKMRISQRLFITEENANISKTIH
jgi:hypothetical protein